MAAIFRVVDVSIRSRIWRLAILACSVLGLLSLLLAWNVMLERKAAAQVERTRAVLVELGAYTGEIVRAETGQRGYLLTLNDSYLDPYWRAVRESSVDLRRLQRQITNPVEVGQLHGMADAMQVKLQELATTIHLAKTGHLAQALAIVRDNRGRDATVRFQKLSADISRRELAYLSIRGEAAENHSRNLVLAMAIGEVLAMVMIVTASSRTVERIQGPVSELRRGIAALAEGRPTSREATGAQNEIGKAAIAFHDMADRLSAATKAQELVEADLERSNVQLSIEVAERGVAQARLAEMVAQLRQSNEDLDAFAYGASHDLRAPLRGLRNLAEWISEDIGAAASAETIENLSLLRSRVDRLDRMLESLLQYSRVGRGGSTPEDIDICQLVGEIADYIAPRPGFTIGCHVESPVIRTGRAPFEQVLRNLVGNALKHNDALSGTVTVSARDLGDTMEFSVEDDGPGIAPSFHERIFQMFQTLKPRDEVEGSGMGLAIVKKTVESHGGGVRIVSAPPRRGATFIFTWDKEPALADA